MLKHMILLEVIALERGIMRSVAVFLGAKDVKNLAYKAAAVELGEALASKEITLVYGGSNTGLMRTLADAVLNANGKVIGVSVDALAHHEAPHDQLTELHITANMHERKSKMAKLADGFISMAGGIGTLEEFFEVYTWARLGFHQKPVALLNTDHYFDHMLQFLDHAKNEGFVDLQARNQIIVNKDPNDLLHQMLQCV